MGRGENGPEKRLCIERSGEWQVSNVRDQKMHGIVLMLNKKVGMHETNLCLQDSNDATYTGGYSHKIAIIEKCMSSGFNL